MMVEEPVEKKPRQHRPRRSQEQLRDLEIARLQRQLDAAKKSATAVIQHEVKLRVRYEAAAANAASARQRIADLEALLKWQKQRPVAVTAVDDEGQADEEVDIDDETVRVGDELHVEKSDEDEDADSPILA
jgi:hypothetical protein